MPAVRQPLRTALAQPKTQAPELRIVAPSYENGASGYYRVVLPLATLSRQGRAQSVWRGLLGLPENPSDDAQTTKRLAQILSWGNVYLLQRDCRPDMIPIVQKARASGRIVAMDIDDDVLAFSHIAEPEVSAFWQSHAEDLKRMINEVDLLITTTEALRKNYSQYLSRDAQAIAIPNYLDTDNPRWSVTRDLPPDRFRFGWMGGPTHGEDLELLREPLTSLLAAYPYAQFKCVGLVPSWVKDLSESLPGQILIDPGYSDLNSYPSRMGDFHVGLIPLARTPFNDTGKSDLKFLEMAYLGMPTIVSKGPTYQSCAVHKKTALLAEDSDSWYDAMEMLLQDRSLYVSLAEAGHAYVLQRRAISRYAYRWADAFWSTLARRHRALSRDRIVTPHSDIAVLRHPTRVLRPS